MRIFNWLYLQFYKTSKLIGDKININADKIMHFTSCFLITFILGILFGVSFGIASSILIGVLKEIYDNMHPNNHFCWKDMLADAIGVIVAASMLIILI